MVQQTRKDPRAKVLSMTVRYKSATLDEFIEHHSHDVSRGGMFIKTPQPFPPGTLLKFEVRIAEDRKVMQGVGRVVWKRDSSAADDERPAGMGVKFIKLDDESRRLIDQLLASRREEDSAFDSEMSRSETGALVSGGDGETGAALEGGVPSFFPKTDSKDMPAPEDRTVMKQAAELLAEALREVGSDAPEGGAGPLISEKPMADLPVSERPPSSRRSGAAAALSSGAELRASGRPARGSESRASGQGPAAKALEKSASDLVASAKAAASTTESSAARRGPNSTRPASSARPAASGRPPARQPSRPAISRPVPSKPEGATSEQSARASAASSSSAKPTTAVAPSSKSSMRGVVWVVAVAASVGAVLWLTRARPVTPPVEPERTLTEEAKPSEPAPALAPPVASVANEESVAMPEPSSAPSIAASVPEVPAAPAALEPTQGEGQAVAAAPAKVESKAMAPKPKAAAAPAKVAPAAAADAPAKNEPSTPAAEPKATEDKPAESKPAEAKPVEEKPAAVPAEAKPAEPKPVETKPVQPAAPKKAKAADSDNPY